MTSTYSTLYAKYLSVLVRVVEIALVVLIAFIAARMVWFAVYGAETSPPNLEFRSHQTRGFDQGRGDMTALNQINIFSARETLAPVGTQLTAPETRLNLTLRGVRTGQSEFEGSAVIEAPNIGQRTLPVGAEITSGVTLEEIYTDRVIINRRGARESLFLREEGPRRTLSVAQTSPSDQQGTAAEAQSQSNARSNRNVELTGEPNLELAAELEAEDWIDGLRMAPEIRDGAMIGFRVRDNARLEVLQASGLLPGDVVTELNGVVLDSPEGAGNAINLFSQTDSVELRVLRNGQNVTLALPLGEG